MGMTEIPAETSINDGKIKKISRIAELAATFGLLIYAALFSYVLYVLTSNGAEADAEISEDFLKKGATASFTTMQRIIGAALIFLSDFVGLAGIYTARNLFAGYQRGEIFTKLAATRLKVIGWVVVLLAPASQLSETIGNFYFTRIVDPASTRVILSLEDTHVFAIIFGLLIVVAGHVMYEAVRINEENKTFV